jgi:hypothetical protein
MQSVKKASAKAASAHERLRECKPPRSRNHLSAVILRSAATKDPSLFPANSDPSNVLLLRVPHPCGLQGWVFNEGYAFVSPVAAPDRRSAGDLTGVSRQHTILVSPCD